VTRGYAQSVDAIRQLLYTVSVTAKRPVYALLTVAYHAKSVSDIFLDHFCFDTRKSHSFVQSAARRVLVASIISLSRLVKSLRFADIPQRCKNPSFAAKTYAINEKISICSFFIHFLSIDFKRFSVIQ
jgi:hypothetical protein